MVVLAGGSARRWGGRDKTAAPLQGRTVLEHAVDGLRTGVRAWEQQNAMDVADAGAQAGPVVVAGPFDPEVQRRLGGDVRWVREDPPGQGPVAGLAAAVEALAGEIEAVVVGAGDAPFGGTAVPRLLTRFAESVDVSVDSSVDPGVDPGVDAAVGIDPAGRQQPLLAVYRVGALRRALATLGRLEAAPLRRVLGKLRVATVPVTAQEALDLDTPASLDEAERLLLG